MDSSTTCRSLNRGNVLTALLVAAALLLLLHVSPVSAHGTNIEVNEVQAIDITARFDNGDPMAGAQVSVYAPSDASTPWLTGTADEYGRYIFTPDRTVSGEWAVQVRTAGHGDWVYLQVDGHDVTNVTASDGFTPMQIIIMSGAVIWGLIGTALYFARGRGSMSTAVQDGSLPHGAS